ncbi:cytochrome P450 6k1-like [Neodiprion virginianus]|uniref:cytochrome P450 6k1-like n=1 Tax=Neodiprion virginianus TaxID=2961670 RepID=UPI001EE70EC4|nr:cytochrome P450 6k1-like [Neodiprion virginianus]
MALLTWYWGLDGILILLSLIFSAYLYMTRNFKYWEKQGVFELQPTAFIGNFKDCLLFRRSAGEFLKDLYDKGKGLKYLGFYIFDKPALLIRDPVIIKNVLIKDFNYFSDRFVAASDTDTLGTANLFSIKNPHWRILRNKLTPVFSSGKLKKMFYLMAAVAEDLDTHLETLNLHGKGRVIELKETCAKYTTDVVGSCAYGLQVNSLNNPEAEFRKYGRKVFTFNYRRALELSTFFFVPGIVKPLGFKFFEQSCSDFLRKALWGAIDDRMKSGDCRNDLIDTLIELKKAQAESDEKDPDAFIFDGDNLVAQAAVFFTAGFETSSTAMSFSMYELALQPNLQRRLRDEINSALDESGGKLSYDMVMNLPYLDMVVKETLRKYPPLPFLDRVAMVDYKVPGTDLVIEKGTPTYIPMFGLHYDPEYFPEPFKYDPERFNEENKQNRASCIYMPFGEGPHICIGLRFGLLQAKLGLVKILSKYEVTPCERTLIPMRLDPKALILSSDGGLYLNVRKI